MAGRLSRSRPAWLFSAGLVVVAGLVVGVAIGVADEPVPLEVIDAVPVRDQPEPEQEPEPEPEPEPPPPVQGDISAVDISDLSATGSRVFHEGSADDDPVAVDDDAVTAFVDDMAAWLDAHLTDLQDDGPGLLDGLAGDVTPVAAALASSDAPVQAATYSFRIGARGAPEWGSATVAIQRGRGVVQHVLYAFMPGDPVVVVAAEVLPVVVEPTDRDQDPAFSAPGEGDGA